MKQRPCFHTLLTICCLTFVAWVGLGQHNEAIGQATGNKRMVSQFPAIAPALPAGLPPGQSGYSVFIEAVGCNSNGGGYQAYRFTIETNPCVAVGADHRFIITVDNYGYRSNSTIVTAPVQIKAGQSSGTIDLLVPSNFGSAWAHVKIKSEYEGVIASSYLTLSNSQSSQQQRDPANLMPGTLLINSGLLQPSVNAQVFVKRRAYNESSWPLQKKKGKIGLPSIHIAQKAFQHPSFNIIDYDDAFAAVNAWSHVFACRPVDLPINWTALSSTDHTFISLADLKAVSKLPAQRDALRRWVAAGGTLIVLGKNAKYKNRDKVFPLLIGVERATLLNVPFDRWTVPTQHLKELNETIVDTSLIRDRWRRQNFALDPALDDYRGRSDWQSDRMDDWDATKLPPFVMQHFANGLVVLADDDTAQWKEQDWRFFYNSVLIENDSLVEHLGSGNLAFHEPQFWIPEVGDPPVKAFQLLIALFMIVAGPVMLIVLKRTRRMQLLFTIIPLLSLLTCGSLFAYAILSDGLVTLGRVRTFTRIDSRTGDAVTHARASYYNGWQPAPYQFDAATVAIQNTQSRGSVKIRRDQQDDSFRYAGGRIRARSPHQIVTMRTYETLCGLRKMPGTESANDSSKKEIRFQNRLTSNAMLVVFRTDDGYFVANTVDAGKSQKAVLTDAESVSRSARKLLKIHSPIVENYMRREEKINRLNGRVSPKYLGDEHRISQLLTAGKISEAMPVNSWLALTTSFEPAEQELGDVELRNVLHIIAGDWQP